MNVSMLNMRNHVGTYWLIQEGNRPAEGYPFLRTTFSTCVADYMGGARPVSSQICLALTLLPHYTCLVHCRNNCPGLFKVFKVWYTPIRHSNCFDLAFGFLVKDHRPLMMPNKPDLYTSSICRHVSC
jgi:hypothetical protein